jgi:hypothetical protein
METEVDCSHIVFTPIFCGQFSIICVDLKILEWDEQYCYDKEWDHGCQDNKRREFVELQNSRSETEFQFNFGHEMSTLLAAGWSRNHKPYVHQVRSLFFLEMDLKLSLFRVRYPRIRLMQIKWA